MSAAARLEPRKLRNITVRDLRAELSARGCRYVRRNGSHEIWVTADGRTLPPFVGLRDSDTVHMVRAIFRALEGR